MAKLKPLKKPGKGRKKFVRKQVARAKAGERVMAEKHVRLPSGKLVAGRLDPSGISPVSAQWAAGPGNVTPSGKYVRDRQLRERKMRKDPIGQKG